VIWHRGPNQASVLDGDGPEGAGLGIVVAASATGTPVAPRTSVMGTANEHDDLREALTAFRAAHADGGVYSAPRTIDPLLELWALASRVDATVARPIEVMLVALVQRSVVTAGELSALADRVEWVLAVL
jgi:hypothetical protein